ncbi:MAG: alpha/beta hydrolase [Pseudomonadota bacterium]
MQELLIKNFNIELCTQIFGDKENPAVVLIYGAAGQGILWNIDLCKTLAKNGYFVIRFDNRDTGKSSGFEYEEAPYNLFDMAKDIISILDEFKKDRAHIVGMSMGGYIAQVLALNFPQRINTITLLMTTINSLALRGIKINNLPGHDSEVIRGISEIYQAPRLSLDDKIDSLTKIWQLFNGDREKFPYEEWRQLAGESYSRARSKNAVKNHRLAVLNSPGDRSDFLKNINVPVLIIHGEADPIIRVEHALYTKQHLPKAKLLIIQKMGHILSSFFVDEVSDALLGHFEGENVK